MPDYSALVQIIKRAGTEAVRAGGPVDVCFGKVVSTLPLRILVDQKMTLGPAQLVLTQNVTDYEVSVTVDWRTKSALSTHSHKVDGMESDAINLEHAHGLDGERKMTIHNSLCKGEEVVLLRQQGGQKYIVIDRVG